MQTTISSAIARRLAALVAVSVALTACNSSPGPNTASGVAAVSGNDQYAIVGSPIANPLVVLVVDQNGSSIANVPVTWTVTGGGGAVADSTSTSDASGHAKMLYTAGSTPGVATVVATVAEFWTATFTVYIQAATQ